MGSYTDRRLYRVAVEPSDLTIFRVTLRETDLLIMADLDLTEEALELTRSCRRTLEEYIADNPGWGSSLEPVETDSNAPGIVRSMSGAAAAAGVGPMAAVAGAVSEAVGQGLRKRSGTVIVENGGDVYLDSPDQRIIGLYAGRGEGEFSIGLRIAPGSGPLGICTSSGVIGPSISLGTARAATVISPSAPLADAAATALGNLVVNPRDIGPALQHISGIEGVTGALAMHGKHFGAWGEVDLVQLGVEGEENAD